MGENLSLSESTAAATLDTARYSALCQDYELIAAELKNSQPTAPGSGDVVAGLLPDPPERPASVQYSIGKTVKTVQATLTSKLLDDHGQGKISILRMVENQKALQAGTTTHSERIVALNPKYVLAQVVREADETGAAPKMSIKEASHRDTKKTWELCWQSSAKHIQNLVTLTDEDDSDMDDDNIGILNFSCIGNPHQYHLHMYASVKTLLYNLNLTALMSMAEPRGSLMALTPLTATRWKALVRKDMVDMLPPLKIKIAAPGKATRKKK
ncbi:hypothetical protein B0H10DRAFT_1938372 [Mycena sp. CBHHK59/15]|nr:hypothetical protein B0H10DRAFT_1938372 [Mycena sp. CBHHK59/15]